MTLKMKKYKRLKRRSEDLEKCQHDVNRKLRLGLSFMLIRDFCSNVDVLHRTRKVKFK